jgi:hypothetical protein
LHKKETLPVGTNLLIDIHNKIGYPSPELIFDVGANEGQTVEWLKGFLTESTIYSFEPVSAIFSRLKQNAGNYQRVFTEQLAFGDEECKKSH